MSKRVNNLIIGKSLTRTETLVIEGSGQNCAVGEVFVGDKHKKLINASTTIATNDVIYVGVALAETHDYTLPDGTAVTGKKRIKWSDPIQGTKVLTYTGISGGTAATERAAKVDITTATAFAPIVGVWYAIRIIYSDILTHPGQFTETHRVKATSTTPSVLTAAFVAKINSMGVTPNESRVIATASSDDLILTGKVIPGNATNDEIDEYSQVDFVVGLHSDNFSDVAVTYTANATPGIGNAKLIRDKEKFALAYEGVTNTINFPVVKPTMLTEMDKWYDVIVIEHDTDYESGETQYIQSTPKTTEIYIPTGAGQTSTTATAGASLLEVLNPWMASTPKTFGTVAV